MTDLAGGLGAKARDGRACPFLVTMPPASCRAGGPIFPLPPALAFLTRPAGGALSSERGEASLTALVVFALIAIAGVLVLFVLMGPTLMGARL